MVNRGELSTIGFLHAESLPYPGAASYLSFANSNLAPSNHTPASNPRLLNPALSTIYKRYIFILTTNVIRGILRHDPLEASLPAPLPPLSRPQTQSPQPLVHNFRHASVWGFPRTASHLSRAMPLQRSRHQHHSAVLRFPLFSYSCALFCIAQNAILNPFNTFRTLCKKHPGMGDPRLQPIYFFTTNLRPEIFRPARRPLGRDQSASQPCVCLPRPSVPRGVR